MRYCNSIVCVSAFVGAGVLLAFATGCTTSYADLQAFVQAHDHDVTGTTYRVKPPDSISISSPGVSEIDGVSTRIGADGKITLKLLGSIKVSEMTEKEIAAKLEELLSRYYVDPSVEVRVSDHMSRKIYVFGQVGGAGPRPFTGRDTLLNVLAQAQPTFIAWKARIKVIRPSATPDEVHEIVVDADEMIRTGDLRNNLLLQEGDIVYVPPTPLGWVGLKVQEVLFPVSPIVSGYTYPADVYAANNAYDDLDERTSTYGGVGRGYGGQINQGW